MAAAVGTIIYLAIIVFIFAAYWVMFTKAGRPGWAAIVPIYNAYVLLKVAGKPGWWLVLLFIPVVNIVFLVLTMVALSNAFGHGGGFAVGLIFLSFIFVPIIAFGDSQYRYFGGGPQAGYPATGYGY